MAMTRRYKVLLVIGLVVRLLGVTLMVRYRTAEDPTYMLVLCQLLQGIGVDRSRSRCRWRCR